MTDEQETKINKQMEVIKEDLKEIKSSQNSIGYFVYNCDSPYVIALEKMNQRILKLEQLLNEIKNLIKTDKDDGK